jgi:hypothetical protein
MRASPVRDHCCGVREVSVKGTPNGCDADAATELMELAEL